jgi:hypothetical protein
MTLTGVGFHCARGRVAAGCCDKPHPRGIAAGQARALLSRARLGAPASDNARAAARRWVLLAPHIAAGVPTGHAAGAAQVGRALAPLHTGCGWRVAQPAWHGLWGASAILSMHQHQQHDCRRRQQQQQQQQLSLGPLRRSVAALASGFASASDIAAAVLAAPTAAALQNLAASAASTPHQAWLLQQYKVRCCGSGVCCCVCGVQQPLLRCECGGSGPYDVAAAACPRPYNARCPARVAGAAAVGARGAAAGAAGQGAAVLCAVGRRPRRPV